MQCAASVPDDSSGSGGGTMQSNTLCVASTMAAATILVTPLCLMRSIESLGPTSTLGACCVLFTSVVIGLHGIDEPETDPNFAWKAVQMRLTAFQASIQALSPLTLIESYKTEKSVWRAGCADRLLRDDVSLHGRASDCCTPAVLSEPSVASRLLLNPGPAPTSF